MTFVFLYEVKCSWKIVANAVCIRKFEEIPAWVCFRSVGSTPHRLETVWNLIILSQTNSLVFIYLFMSRHEVHSMNTHTLQNADWSKQTKQNVAQGIEAGGITGLQTLLQLPWRQNHRVTDTFLTLLLANT